MIVKINLLRNDIPKTNATFSMDLDHIGGLYQVTDHQCVIKVHRSGSKRCIRFTNFAPKKVNVYYHHAVCFIVMTDILPGGASQVAQRTCRGYTDT